MTKRNLAHETWRSALLLLAFAAGCGGNSTDSSPGSAGAGPVGTNGGGTPTSSQAGGAQSSAGRPSTSGSAGGSSGGSFSTNVPGSTPLTSLTPEQQTQLCADVQKYLGGSSSPVTDYECKSLALATAAQATTDPAAQAACKAALAGCTPDASSTTCDVSSEPATCTATVADATTCINDTIAAFAALDAKVPPCDGLTVTQAQTALLALVSNSNAAESPPFCTKYNAECDSMTGMP
jgi:hypothetical protein